MTSQLLVNMVVKSVLLTIMLMTYVRADDFEELNMEEEVGSNSSGYYKYRDKLVPVAKGWNGTFIFKDDLLWLACSPYESALIVNFPPFKEVVYPKKVAIQNCVLPASPLAKVLQDLNINVPTVEFMQFATLGRVEPWPKAEYMQGLNIKSLFIETLYSSNIFENNPDILKPLSNLKTLILWGNSVFELPENINLEVLSLRYDTWIKKWNNCKHLRVLSVHSVEAKYLPRYWPEECQNLTKIRLKSLTRWPLNLTMVSDISPTFVNLEILHIQDSYLSLPYEILMTAKKLKHLYLKGNRITDETLAEISLLQNVTKLDLSERTCAEFLLTLAQLPALEWLSLKNLPICVDCFENITFPKLEYLNIASSVKTDAINLRKLPMTDAKHLNVDLRGRQIQRIDFNSDDYFDLRKRTHTRHHTPRLTILLNNTEYNCQNYWFCLAVLDFPDLFDTDLNCSRAKNNSLIDFKELNCRLEYKKGCFIESDKYGNGDIVECNDTDNIDLQRLTEVFEITQVNLKNNRITFMKNVSLPDTVERIDLRGNHLSHFNNSDLEDLFKNNRTLLISNNSFTCSCDLVTGLQKFQLQIEDYNEIICTDTETPLHELSPEKICTKKSYKLAFIITASVIFVIQVTFLTWWYKNHLKRFFYHRGWCLCCCKIKENDAVAWSSVEPSKTTSQQDLVEA